jgi:hypothetical protein
MVSPGGSRDLACGYTQVGGKQDFAEKGGCWVESRKGKK